MGPDPRDMRRESNVIHERQFETLKRALTERSDDVEEYDDEHEQRLIRQSLGNLRGVCETKDSPSPDRTWNRTRRRMKRNNSNIPRHLQRTCATTP